MYRLTGCWHWLQRRYKRKSLFLRKGLRDVRQFILERLRHYCMEQGATTRQVNAVLSAPMESLADFAQRLEAVGNFMQHDDSDSLVAANKRIGNILKKQGHETARRGG